MIDKDVTKAFEELKKKCQKLQDKVHVGKYIGTSKYEMMVRLLDNVKESIEKVDTWTNAGEFGASDDEIWRANVDVEALEGMLQALDSSK